MKKQTKKQLRKEYNALSIECHHLITEQFREFKELQKLYDEKDNEIKELELRVRNLLDGKEIKALLEDAHLTEVILTDRIVEKDNKIKELQAHHDEVVQGVKERYMEWIDEKDKENKKLEAGISNTPHILVDLQDRISLREALITEKDRDIKELRTHHDEVVQEVKERYMERIVELNIELNELRLSSQVHRKNAKKGGLGVTERSW